jgi:8-oxo-dGTP pyrophosphatase MutT (NUDIX family)
VPDRTLPNVATARAAATAVLVRDDPSGALEVFLVQRHRRSGFLPNAWVFPGGRVEDADRARAASGSVCGGDALAAGFGLPRAEAAAHGVASVRETYEEAGIWLGAGDPDAPRIDLDRLRAWSWWVTPEAEPRRYDTRFVVAVVADVIGRHDDVETVASQWIAPARAIAAGQSTLPLAPPTWWTLRELAVCGSVAAVLAAVRHADRPIRPIMRFEEGGMFLLLPGHPDHPDAAIPALPDRITGERDRWVAWSGDAPLSDPSASG